MDLTVISVTHRCELCGTQWTKPEPLACPACGSFLVHVTSFEYVTVEKEIYETSDGFCPDCVSGIWEVLNDGECPYCGGTNVWWKSQGEVPGLQDVYD